MSDPLYRTPVGTQSETADEDTVCQRCGGPLGTYSYKLQGADPEVRPHPIEGERIPRQCQRCSIALTMKPSY